MRSAVQVRLFVAGTHELAKVRIGRTPLVPVVGGDERDVHGFLNSCRQEITETGGVVIPGSGQENCAEGSAGASPAVVIGDADVALDRTSAGLGAAEGNRKSQVTARVGGH